MLSSVRSPGHCWEMPHIVGRIKELVRKCAEDSEHKLQGGQLLGLLCSEDQAQEFAELLQRDLLRGVVHLRGAQLRHSERESRQ
jgi:hypothetical protein